MDTQFSISAVEMVPAVEEIPEPQYIYVTVSSINYIPQFNCNLIVSNFYGSDCRKLLSE